MKIELSDTEVYEIISKYTGIPFGVDDSNTDIITADAVREVIHKEDMIGQSWSWYERLRKTKFCEYIMFVKNHTDPCICYYCQNKACDKVRCKQCRTVNDVNSNRCSSCSDFIEPSN